MFSRKGWGKRRFRMRYKKEDEIASKGEIVIYQAKDKQVQLEVKLEQKTVWLSQKQMVELFEKDVRTINEHLHNTFKEKELLQNSLSGNSG
jgi:hypothetical protein